MNSKLNKIEKFKKQFSITKPVKFKKGKKMDKKIIQDIQLIIKDLFLNGDLSNSDLLNDVKLLEVKKIIVDILTSMLKKKGDIAILDQYEKCIEEHLLESVIVQSPTYNSNDLQKLSGIIKHLKTIPQPEQRTPEWYTFRKNRLTASDLGTVIGVNPYEKYNSVIQKKCGYERPFIMNNNIRRGVKFEEVICKVYEFRNDVKVFEYGCLPHPKIPHFGASPDGIVDNGSNNTDLLGRMLEIKCPNTRPITGFCPPYYFAQVQGQLEVCDLEYCDFVECRLDEYDSKTDYFNDFLLEDGECNYCLQANKMEKGFLIEAYDTNLKKDVFYYSEIGLNYEEAYKWENDIIDTILESEHLEYNRTTYWKVIEYNALIIKRDKRLFDEEYLPKINKFWEDVLENREKSLDEVIALCPPSKRKFNEFKKPNVKIEDFTEGGKKKPSLFLSDSEDE